MATNAATKLPTSWPGTSSQLASGAGGAVTVAPASALSGGTLTVGGSRNPIDASHVGVWYLAEAPSGPFVNQVAGGPALGYGATTTTGAAYTGPIFRQYACLGPGANTVATAAGQVQLVAASSITTAAPLTLECVIRINESAAPAANWLAVTYVDATNGLYIAHNNSGGNFRMTYRRNGAADVDLATIAYGAGSGQIARGRPHHVMMTWSGTAVTAYLDGEVVATATPGAPSASVVAAPTANAALGMYVADLRISNVARDITYARNAFAALCAG